MEKICETKTFSLRLDREEQESLEKLKIFLQKKKSSEVIRHVIKNFSEVTKAYISEQRESKILKKKLDDKNKDIQNFIFAFDRLRNKE